MCSGEIRAFDLDQVIWFADARVAPLPAALAFRAEACYAVRDRGGQKLAYVYFKDGLTVDRWGCMNGALE